MLQLHVEKSKRTLTVGEPPPRQLPGQAVLEELYEGRQVSMGDLEKSDPGLAERAFEFCRWSPAGKDGILIFEQSNATLLVLFSDRNEIQISVGKKGWLTCNTTKKRPMSYDGHRRAVPLFDGWMDDWADMLQQIVARELVPPEKVEE